MFDLNINNFRGFQSQEFQLKRINLLLGENNSGKSSLMKFLFMLKQTLDEKHDSNLFLNSDLVDVGNYSDFVHSYNNNNNVKFNFKFDNRYNKFFLNYFLDVHKEGTKIREMHSKMVDEVLSRAFHHNTHCDIEIDKNLEFNSSLKINISNAALGSLNVEIVENKKVSPYAYKPWEQNLINIKYHRAKSNDLLRYENIEFDKTGFLIFPKRIPMIKAIANPEIAVEIGFLIDILNYLDVQLLRIKYFNPAATITKRYYNRVELKKEAQKNSIERLISLLENKKFSEGYHHKLNKIISDFGLGEEINVVHDSKSPMLELKIKNKGLHHNVFDLGNGILIQLPLLFEAMIAESWTGNTFLIENPEIFLSPRLQHKFVDTLIGFGYKNNYIIETHSTHILHQMQDIIKNNRFGIKKSDVGIFYFTKDNNVTKVTHHSFDEQGNISPDISKEFCCH